MRSTRFARWNFLNECYDLIKEVPGKIWRTKKYFTLYSSEDEDKIENMALSVH